MGTTGSGAIHDIRTGARLDSAYLNTTFSGAADKTYGDGGGGGMDAWQQSVETRLGALDGRLNRVDERLGRVETSLATITERVAHLPTKTSLYSTAVAIVLAITAAISFGQKLQSLVSPDGSNASSSHQIEAAQNNN